MWPAIICVVVGLIICCVIFILVQVNSEEGNPRLSEEKTSSKFEHSSPAKKHRPEESEEGTEEDE